jgi:hypothetical protein
MKIPIDGLCQQAYNPRLAATVAGPESQTAGGFGRKSGPDKKEFDRVWVLL